MITLIEWAFIIISTIISLISFNRIVKYKTVTIADLVIITIYVFNCFPVFLDNVIGIPKYYIWFSYFEIALKNETIGLIYNCYILFSMIGLSLYAFIRNKNVEKQDINTLNNSILFKNKKLLIL